MRAQRTPWIFRPREFPSSHDDRTVITLVLFPPAGTGATVFNPWIEQLQSTCPDWCGFRVLPVELPGRGMRMKEPLLYNMNEVVDGVVRALMDTYLGDEEDASPIVVLGHSLGGWIAFETVRELEKRRGQCVTCLIASAIRSPRQSGVENDIDSTAMHLLEEDEFWSVMEKRYGKNKELEHPSIRKFMYPVLKADFTISETYSPETEATVSCPLSVSGGLSDVRYTRDMLDAWAPCTTSGRSMVQMFDGGHSYLFRKDETCAAHVDFVVDAVYNAVHRTESQYQQDDVQSKRSEHKSASDMDALSTQCQAQETMSISSHAMTEPMHHDKSAEHHQLERHDTDGCSYEQRLVDQLSELARFSDDPNPAVTRVLFTENDVLARKYIISLMEDAGLEVQVDAMGSIVGTWMPPDQHGSARGSVMTGSHCDAIPLAGAYDGTVGVLGGIEAVRALKSSGFVPSRPIQVIMFTSEEPTRFGLSCISSRAMAGVLGAEGLSHVHDNEGMTFMQAARKAGIDWIQSEEDIIKNVSSYSISSFVELHIEQGPELEASNTDIGIVTAIAAPSAFYASFKGEGGHAGALLMPHRHDASLAAAELALEVEKLVLSTGSIDIVGTVGKWHISPGAINSVPRVAELEIDVRDPDPDRRSTVIHQIKEAAKTIASRRGVEHEFKTLNIDPPAVSNAHIVRTIEAAASHFNLSSTHMISRAYHDSLFMAQISDMGMIFVPSKAGISHRPDEFTSPHHIAQGVAVLAYTLQELAGPGEASQKHTEL